MLKQRIATAIVIIALLFLSIYVVPARYFAWIVGVVVMFAAWEWSALSGMRSHYVRIAYLILIAGLFLILNQFTVLAAIHFMSAIAITWWMWSLIFIIRYQRQVKILRRNAFAFSMLGIFVLLPFWFSITVLNLEQRLTFGAGQVLLFVIILVALADTSAYFVGKKWGKHKLASRVSPGKTWEGFLGAVFVVSFFVVPLAQALGITQYSRLELTLIGIALVIFGLLGDLFESLVKRLADVKDSGTLLPGHGGILDRIDAYTAAMPIFMAIYFFT